MYEKFLQYEQGLISINEFREYCDKNNIQGAIEVVNSKVVFIGYDYKNQNWIRIN